MSESLFSSSWYRVAELRPRLRSHALVHRHVYRGQVWHVLQDRSSGRFHRFSPTANLIIGLMDGKRSLREIWETACTSLGDDAPTQDEVVGVLASLHRADALQAGVRPDMRELHQRNKQLQAAKLKQYLANPLSLRFPLFDPDRLLEWMNPLGRFLFGPLGLLLWLGLVGWALAAAGQHWSELSKNSTDQIFAAENLLLMALVFPFAKLVHEFGHAMAVKARSGEVHEMGVMLLVLMPIPYLDASASLALRDKYSRMLVGAAGMLAEIALAALAMLVWVNAEPGTVRALAYNLMLVAGVSTLVFNANPLLRFDGYYIFSDWLEIPNLGQRANAHFTYLIKRHLLGVAGLTPGDDMPGERAWFVGYAVSSFAYRMFISLSIALLVAQQYFFLGVLLAIWSLWNSLLLPLAKQIGYLYASNELRSGRWRAVLMTVLTVCALAGLVFWLPAPSWTRTEGVTLAPRDAGVRASVDGFVSALTAGPNQTVTRGQPLIVTEDPEHAARVRVLGAQLGEQLARYSAAHDDPVQMGIIGEEIVHLRQRLAEARQRMADLVLRSPGDGIFLMPDAGDLPGRYLRRGELVGYVLDRAALSVQVVVPQGDIDLVLKATRRIDVRLAERLAEPMVARIKRVVPAATNQLPGRALGAQGGGELALDPESASARDGEARSASTQFIFELEIESRDAAPLSHVGSRVHVRFEREPEPLGQQAYRALRRVLLSMFNV